MAKNDDDADALVDATWEFIEENLVCDTEFSPDQTVSMLDGLVERAQDRARALRVEHGISP